MSQRLLVSGFIAITVISLAVWTSKKYFDHSPESIHRHSSSDGHVLPTEGGQAAFAALIEIVAMLEQDKDTDWNKVDIDSLREHLLDMDKLILDTNANTSVIADDQIQFQITGSTTSVPSIHRMVPAHARYIAQTRDIQIETQLNENGATVNIFTNDALQSNTLEALGFYGFMALDSHHQLHHYQMAIGQQH